MFWAPNVNRIQSLEETLCWFLIQFRFEQMIVSNFELDSGCAPPCHPMFFADLNVGIGGWGGFGNGWAQVANRSIANVCQEREVGVSCVRHAVCDLIIVCWHGIIIVILGPDCPNIVITNIHKTYPRKSTCMYECTLFYVVCFLVFLKTSILSRWKRIVIMRVR